MLDLSFRIWKTRAMNIGEYLEHSGLTASEFARRIGVHPPAVTKYRWYGQIPSRAVMARIASVTGGLVGPVDFYDQFNPARSVCRKHKPKRTRGNTRKQRK